MRTIAWAVLAAVLLVGCKGAEPEQGSASDGVLEAPPIRVADDNQGLAFRYLDASSGKMATVSIVADVPEEVRAAVMVIDTNAEPAPPNVIYVADLTKKKGDGTYGYRVVDRFAYERARAPQVAREERATSVTIYSAEWCGACKQAKSWMKSNGVAFVERDVEKDPRALDDLRADAQRAGVPFSSLARKVPVIVVGDKVMSGFDPGAIQAALGAKNP